MRDKVLVIVGPTASGKSDLGVYLAQKLGGEVISADSRQVYKGLDIGSGKITKREMRGVKHYLLDVADPKKIFSASEYKDQAEEALKDILTKERLPIIVGGTGFYIDALVGRASLPEVPRNDALRKKLEKLSAQKLFTMLQKQDPRRAKSIDPHNKVRLIRALEIVHAIGQVPKQTKRNRKNAIFIGLKPEDLEERIEVRLKKRLPGIIKECRTLHKQGLTWKRMRELGLEYRYASLYLQGKMDKQEFEEKLFIEIRKYAKRQMTWFKRNEGIKWFTPQQYNEIEKYARIALKGD